MTDPAAVDVDTLVKLADEFLEWLAANERGDFNICCQRCNAPFEHEGHAVAAPPEWYGGLEWEAQLANGVRDLAARARETEQALANGDRLLSQAGHNEERLARRVAELEAALRGVREQIDNRWREYLDGADAYDDEGAHVGLARHSRAVAEGLGQAHTIALRAVEGAALAGDGGTFEHEIIPEHGAGGYGYCEKCGAGPLAGDGGGACSR